MAIRHRAPRPARRDDEDRSDRSTRWRQRYEGSVVHDLVRSLGAVEFGDRIILFGAALLLSVLPLVILLSAFASTRVDDDIAKHLGLNRQGSRMIEGLFRSPNVSFNLGILVACCSPLPARSPWRGRCR